MKREYPASHAKLIDEEKKEVKVHEWTFVEIHGRRPGLMFKEKFGEAGEMIYSR